MEIRELLERLKSETMKDVCMSLNVNPTTIQRRLKKIGYQWDKHLKTWEWSGEDREPLEKDILEGIESTIPTIKANGQSGQKEESITYQTGRTESLTGEEIRTLREIIQEWNNKPRESHMEPRAISIYDRVAEIKQEEKKRKTIVINKTISDRLDKFSNDRKIDKQDIIEIALIDFMDKYQ